MEYTHIGTESMITLGICAALAFIIPVAVAVIWIRKKKEPVSTVLIGAATFLLFAVIIEKPIQNILIFPTVMGLPGHAVSRFIDSRPVLWGILVGLFPGVFEETGRLVAFKTVLRKRTNRETSISHGIGHGCFEVMFIIGVNMCTYLMYAFMINAGTFGTIVDQVAATAPGQMAELEKIVANIANYSFVSLGMTVLDRIWAVLYHTGASIMVFYACSDKKKYMLYPLAILIHTVIDGIAGLNMKGVISLTDVQLEGVSCFVGLLTFVTAYMFLYRKDKDTEVSEKGA